MNVPNVTESSGAVCASLYTSLPKRVLAEAQGAIPGNVARHMLSKVFHSVLFVGCAGYIPPAAAADYTAHVAAASKRFDLPADLISAVIGVESGGDAKAVSNKGAQGVMQIMPATWHEVEGWFAAAGTPLGTDAFEPKDNILAGTAYLKAQIDRFGLTNGIAAYNAGPKRVDAWISSGTALPTETKSYVAKVSARMGANDHAPVVIASVNIPAWDVFARARANLHRTNGVVLLND